MLIWLLLVLGMNANPYLVTGVFVILYILTYYKVQNGRTYINLHEQGVHVIKGNKEETWTWEQLTHFEGTRESHGMYFIPIVFFGFNDFYAGETVAFHLGSLTAGANILAHYCLARMAQVHTPKIVKTIQQGETFQIHRLTITKRSYCGVEYKFPVTLSEYEYTYAEIEQHHFKNDGAIDKYKFQVKLRDEKKKRDLLSINAQQAYYLMGIVDGLQGTNFLEEVVLDIIVNTRRWKKNLRVNWLIVTVFLLIVVIVALAIYDISS